MQSSTLGELEYHKILDIISEYSTNQDAIENIKNLRPMQKSEEIKKSLEEIDEAFILCKKFLPPVFYDLGSMRTTIKRIAGSGVLSNLELLSIASLFKNSRKLIVYYGKNEGCLSEYFKKLKIFKDLENEIFNSIISSEQVSDNASSKLKAIRRAAIITEGKIKNFLRKILNSEKFDKFLQEKLVTVRHKRFVLPIKAQYKNQVLGIVHDVSHSGNTLFIEPSAATVLNNELRELSLEEKREIEKILFKLSMQVFENLEAIEETYENIIKIEVIFAKAKFAIQTNSTKPTINVGGNINLKNARNPLISSKKVVPLNIKLGYDFDCLIITGANTGGKTVLLKTVGLFCLMAQTGFFLPTDSGSEVSIFENIFANIGDHQSIEKNLSTFSSHMKNIIEAVNLNFKNSLILLDEIGAGTDPTEGAALAMSLLDFFKNNGNRVLATTHYPELKTYALSSHRVTNGSFEFDVEKIRPTYKFQVGVPGKSHAFSISLKLQMPEFIVSNAKDKMTKLKIDFHKALEKIEFARQNIEKDEEKIQKLKIEIENLKSDVEREKESVILKSENIIKEQEEKMLSILSSAKCEVDKMISSINEAKKEEDEKEFIRKIEEVRKNLNLKIKGIKSKKTRTSVFDKVVITDIDSFFIGQNVFVKSIGKVGKIYKINKKDETVRVKIDSMTFNTDLNDVTIVKESLKKNVKHKNESGKFQNLKLSLSSQIDLRGLTVEEAVLETEKFLSDAMIGNLKIVNIIHGKGTGALRKAIHELLKNQNFIKKFRLGNFGEGDTGVTIAELK